MSDSDLEREVTWAVRAWMRLRFPHVPFSGADMGSLGRAVEHAILRARRNAALQSSEPPRRATEGSAVE